jgi:hypothetical protein
MSFVQFAQDDLVVSTQLITAPLWSGNSYTLSGSFYTSSAQETSISGKTYLNVYNLPINSSGSATQFSVAYGHISGSGSALFNALVNEKSPTRDVYGQFRNLVYGNDGAHEGPFNFGGSNGLSRDIFVINVNRSRYKESINPGTWQLQLKNGSNIINLTDDSNTNSTTTNFIGSNIYYNIVSGSLGYTYNSTSVQTNSGSYGLFFPNMGLIILNPRALSLSTANGGIGLSVDETAATSYTAGYNINNSTLFTVISASSAGFSANSRETVSSTYFFVNAKSTQLNYTTNPSITDSNGNLLFPVLVNNPQTYPTTVGLYNNNGDLLAVGKLSKPLAKDFTKQLTCRVKLEF